jgi:type IV secretion system protein VirB4
MTRANTEQAKFVPWFAKAGAACSIVPIARFVGLNVFAIKGGGYGCLFALNGIDEEGLTDQELEARMRSVEGALHGLPEGSCLYQYTRVISGFELPRQKLYRSPVTKVFAGDRLSHLGKTACFRRIDLHWCLTLEPPKIRPFEQKPKQHAISTSRMLAELEKTATILVGHLGTSFGLRLLDKTATFNFFSYLFNLQEWAAAGDLRGDEGIDRQIVKNPVSWHSDHLRVGKRHVQMFSLKTTPEASRPCLFSGLLSLDCDSILCSTWRPRSASAARSEIDAQEKFISFFKVGVLTRVMSGRDFASLESGAGARAANRGVDDLSEVIRSLDKKAQGEYSLRLLLAANTTEQLRNTIPFVHRIFVDARSQVIEETLGNLSAFYTMFPGNGKFNVFPLWLSEEHHARLSSVFAPHIGHPRSEDLDAEYLNIFETRTRTPFFQDVYVDGVRVMLILGPTGTGKSVHGNQLIAFEQKYGGFSYIFDIGGSYESVVELYGGRVDRIGKDGPRVNPFALEPTESNLKFLYSFVRLLLANGGAELEPEDDDVIHRAVQDMYLLDRENRRLSNLYLPKKLDRYLSKWVRDGVYHAIFDNVEDSLSLSRLQCFDFQGVNNEQYADLIEPLMVWLLRRINDVLYDSANLVLRPPPFPLPDGSPPRHSPLATHHLSLCPLSLATAPRAADTAGCDF